MRLKILVSALLVSLVLFVGYPNNRNCRSSQYSNHVCADYSRENYDKIVFDGYIMGVHNGWFGSDTHAFYKGAGELITPDIENSLVYDGNNYTAMDCAHFVSSSLIYGGYFLTDNFPPAKGIVGAYDLYYEICVNRGQPAYLIQDAINLGIISVGDPVFLLSEDDRIFHSAIYVGNDEIAYHTTCRKVKYYEIGYKKIAVHIQSNSDDFSDTNNKFSYYMNFAVNSEATPFLNIRDNPGINQKVISRKVPGERGVIIGGPDYRDGYYWWNVRFSNDNLVGWCAGAYLKRN